MFYSVENMVNKLTWKLWFSSCSIITEEKKSPVCEEEEQLRG